MSTEKRKIRRDDDPIKVFAGGRYGYWTGGRVGEGEREVKRFKKGEDPVAVIEALRAELAQTRGMSGRATTTLDDLVQEMANHQRTHGANVLTVRQHNSDWRANTPDALGEVRCHEIGLPHFTMIFDYVTAKQASESVVNNVARTIGAITDWGVNHGYFPDANPFGDPRRLRSIVKKAKKAARIHKAESDNYFPHALCPKVADIEKLVVEMEVVYPGYGARLILLCFATGLRVNEALALRHDSIDVATGTVKVLTQLDRTQHWPATKLPKGEKTREAFMWAAYTDVAESLIADSLALDSSDPHHGWLFPPYNSVGWADQAGKLGKKARDASDWARTFNWLRHAYATYSLLAESAGGYGLDLASVSSWLGHAKISTTQDMYVERRADDVSDARTRTARKPGEVGA